MTIRRLAVLLLMLLLLLGALVFGAQQIRLAGGELVKVWKVAGQPGLWRSAKFAQNQNFANAIRFLVENIPEDGRVVLPPAGDGPWAYTNTAFMQFFLAPRQVINCPPGDAQCLAGLVQSGAYLLVVAPTGIPGELLSNSPDRLVKFDANLSILRPEDAPAPTPGALPPEESLLEVLRMSLGPLLWLAWLCAAGWLLVQGMGVPLGRLSQLALGFGLASGALTWLIFLALWAGLPLTIGLSLAAAGIVMLAALGVFVLGRAAHATQDLKRPAYAWKDAWWILGLVAWGAVMLVLAVGKGFHATDSIVLWGVKGYGIAQVGLSQAATEWGTRTSEYPLHLPVWIAANKILFNDALPGSKLIYPGFYLGLLFLMADFLRRRLPAAVAALAVLVFAFTPLIARHAVIAYANLPLTFYLAAAAMLVTEAMQAREHAVQKRLLLLAGLSAALAVWTRPEALWMSVIFVLWVAGWVIWNRPRGSRLRLILPAVLPPILLLLVWLAASPDVYLRPMREASIRQAAVQQAIAGDLHWAQIVTIGKYLLAQASDLRTWGILIPMILLLVTLALAFKSCSQPGWMLLLLGVVLVLPFLGVYWAASYDTRSDLQWWLSTGFNRMLMPGITILWLAAWVAGSVVFENQTNQNVGEMVP